MASTPETTMLAKCMCQGVKIQLNGSPVVNSICHCTDCQQATGTWFASVSLYKSEQVEIIEGRDLIQTYTDKSTDSGKSVLRHFCKSCGATLYTKNPDREQLKDLFGISTGILPEEERQKWSPDYEIFTCRKPKWLPPFNGPTAFDKMPPIDLEY